MNLNPQVNAGIAAHRFGWADKIATTEVNEAAELVLRRYSGRGLKVPEERYECTRTRDAVTCLAWQDDKVVGTVCVRFDGEHGLHADALFGPQLNAWRAEGWSLCEFGRLAVESDAAEPKPLLARIYHMAFLLVCRRASDRLVIEVNPRHVPFYRRWLGFEVAGESKFNERVGAAAVLMTIETAKIAAQIQRYGGQPGLFGEVRNLYPFAFSPIEVAQLEGGMQSADTRCMAHWGSQRPN